MLASRHVASAGVDSTSSARDDKKQALRIRLLPVAMSLFERTLHRGHGSSDQFKITRLSDSSCEVSAASEETESDLQYVASRGAYTQPSEVSRDHYCFRLVRRHLEQVTTMPSPH